MKIYQFIRSKRFPILVLALILLAAIPFAGAGATEVGLRSATPKESVLQAWELVQEMNAYDFSTDIQQTTYPAPRLTNVGRSPSVGRVSLEGEVDYAESYMLLSMRQDAGSTRNGQPSIDFRVENGRAYQRTGDEWKEIENISGVFAPDNDLLAYLAGIKDVQRHETEARSLPNRQNLTFTRYSFSIDGPQVANYMRRQLERQMRENGELPGGISLNVAKQYQEMTGDGEIWIDGDGLPARISLALSFPPDNSGDHLKAEVKTDLYGFDRSQLAAAQSLQAKIAGRLNLPAPQDAARQALFLAAALGGVVAILTFRRSRKLQGALATLIVISMLAGPLLQGSVYAATQQRLARPQVTNDQGEQHQENGATEFSSPAWNPKVDPLSQEVNSELGSPASALGVSMAGGAASRLAANESNLNDDGVDSDGDGLSDDQEANFETDPDNPDTDGDTLTDGQEVLRLGTNPILDDTDGDSLADNVEVGGFLNPANGQLQSRWYSDPNQIDTNKDRIADGLECDTLAGVTNPPASATCPDTDGNGTPDIFDPDNDGDGVGDAVDLSPGYHEGMNSPFTAGNPYHLSVNGLKPGLPAFVDIQLRPSNAKHLTYAMNVLDWPSPDTDGQVKRLLETTWASTATAEFANTDERADYGDLRLIPMLEIEIPFDAGHFGNLPVKPGVQSITPETPLEDWLDKSKLDPYGINVRQSDEDGSLLLLVPLTIETSQNGGDQEAFSAHIPYEPTLDTWGDDQLVRMTWMINMLTDVCVDEEGVDCSDPQNREDTITIVQIYDDDWYLTGLEVREDHGMEIALAIEDPLADDNLAVDDELWQLGYGLSTTFLTGRDCGQAVNGQCSPNGQRDITVDEIKTRFDSGSNGGASDEERWDIPANALKVETFSYPNQDFIAHIMMTETVKILNDNFSPGGQLISEAPTVLFAHEDTFRSVNLHEGPLDFSDRPLMTYAFLSWAPYQYDGQLWQAYPVDDYIELLDTTLSSTPGFRPEDEDLDDPQELEDIAKGKRITATSFYLALYQGQTAPVETDVDGPLSIPNPVTDGDLVEIKQGSGTGVASKALAVPIAVILTINKYGGFKDLKTDFFALYFGAVGRSEGLQFATNLYINGFKTLGPTGAALIAGSIMVILELSVYAAVTSGSYLEGLFLILNGIGLAMSLINTVTLISLIVTDATKELEIFADSLAPGKVGTIIAVVVTWGMVWYQIENEKLKTGSREFNTVIAGGLASTLFLLILYVAAFMIPLFGALLALFIALFDGVAFLICTLADLKGTFCGGITGFVVSYLAPQFYTYDVLIDISDGDRLALDQYQSLLANEAGGITTANSVSYALSGTNTLRKGERSGGNSPYDLTYGRKTTFAYELSQDDDTTLHGSLGLSQMKDDWTAVLRNNNIDYQMDIVAASPSVPLANVGTGINRVVPMYLLEGYAIPARECWSAPGIYVSLSCKIKSLKGTNPINFSKVYDILPPTLSEFYELVERDGGWSLAWGRIGTLTFPRQLDADGDGLRNKQDGGDDPNDSMWDSDGDGLSDNHEIRISLTSPTLVDSDNDQLSDGDELIWNSDPNRPDSDFDGLLDGEEVAGWEYIYDLDAGGQALKTWVRSDPLLSDEDGDELLDAQEKAFGFHPQVASDPTVLTYQAEILRTDGFDDRGLFFSPGNSFDYEASVKNELFNRDANGLLTTELAGGLVASSSPFVNFFLRPQEATTIGDTVTVAAQTSGVYRLSQQAGAIVSNPREGSNFAEVWLPFEGDLIDRAGNVPPNDAICYGALQGCDNTHFVATTSADNPASTQSMRFDGSNGILLDQPLSFDDDFTIAMWFMDQELRSDPGSFNHNRWLLRAYNPLDPGLGDLRLYRERPSSLSQDLITFWKRTRLPGGSFSGPIISKGLPDPAYPPPPRWHHVAVTLNGTLVTLYVDGVKFSSANTWDPIGAPLTVAIGHDAGNGDDFIGLIDDVYIYDRALPADEIGELAGGPIFKMSFDSLQADGKARTFTATCVPGSQCPAATTGIVGPGSVFNGSNHYEFSSNAGERLDLSSGQFTEAIWLYPTTSKISGLMGFIDGVTPASASPPALFVDNLGHPVAGFGDGANWNVFFATNPVITTQKWHHLVSTFDGQEFRIYVDGELLESTSEFAGRQPVSVPVAKFKVGQVTPDTAGSADNFVGSLDEARLYNYALSPELIKALYNEELVALDVTLDAAPGASSFPSTAGINGLACAPFSTCPVTGLPGRIGQVALFDGLDDQLAFNAGGGPAVVTELTNNVSMAAWVKWDGNSSERAIVYNGNPGSSGYGLWLTNGQVRILNGGIDWANSGFNLNPGQWYHLAAVRENSVWKLYVDGSQRSLTNNPVPANPANNNGHTTVGATSTGDYAFAGMIDEVRIYRKALSAAEVQLLFQEAPELAMSFEDPAGATSFADNGGNHTPTCSGTACPKTVVEADGQTAEVRGQIGLAAQFDGQDDAIVLGSAPSLGIFDSSFTVLAWINGDTFGPGDQAILGTDEQSDNQGLGLIVSNGQPLMYFNSNGLVTDTTLVSNVWYQIAYRYDKIDGEMAVFINGAPVKTSTGNLPFIGTGQVRVGRYWGGNYFDGRIDELNIYGRALSDDELRQIYRYQSRWVEERQSVAVTVDNDLPITTIATDGQYLSNEPIQLSIYAHDPTSNVTKVELGINGVWQEAPPCLDTPEGTAWCPLFVPVSGQGLYALQSRATDTVGNIGLSPVVNVLVDGTPLSVTSDIADGSLLPATPDSKNRSHWFVSLSGTVTDPAIQGQAGSGVLTVKVKFTPLGDNKTSQRTMEAVVENGLWHVDYLFTGNEPTGPFAVHISARDQVGNDGELLLSTVYVDASAPEATLSESGTPGDVVSSNLPIDGTVSDLAGPVGNINVAAVPAIGVDRVDVSFLPSPLGSVFYNDPPLKDLKLHLPLEEEDPLAGGSAISLKDISGNSAHAACSGSSCPSLGNVGHSGSAANFDGHDDYITADAVSPKLAGFSASFGGWVAPDATGSGLGSIVAFNGANGSDRGFLGYDYMTKHFIYVDGKSIYQSSSTFDPGTWHHTMVVLDGDLKAGFLYVDGSLEASFDALFTSDSNDKVSIGQRWIDSTTSDHFAGAIDEVQIYSRPLIQSEIQSLWRGSAPLLRMNLDEAWASDLSEVEDNSGWQNHGLFQSSDDDNKAVPGVVGAYALHFDGADDFVDAGNQIDLANKAFSISIWAKRVPQGTGQNQRFVGQGTTVTNKGLSLGYTADDRFICDFHNNSLVAPNSLGTTEWHQLVCSYDPANGVRRLYVDGVEVAQDNPGSHYQGSGSLTLGSALGGMNFAGSLDNAVVYPRALPAAEVKSLYGSQWQPATVASPGAAESPWSSQIPAGLEGFFQLDLRGWDRYDQPGNNDRGLWRGLIDTLGPRISVTQEEIGGETHYITVAEDFNLVEEGFNSPCGAGVVDQRETFDSPWLTAFFPEIAQAGRPLYRLTADCTSLPSAFAEAASVQTIWPAHDLVVAGNHAYVASEGALEIVDVTDPANPLPRKKVATTGGSNVVAVDGNLAYIASAKEGILIADISNPNSPFQIAAFDGTPTGIALSGNYAYISSSDKGLQVYDVSDPGKPKIAGDADFPNRFATSVAIANGFAYVGTEGLADNSGNIFGLHIIDLLDPDKPNWAGSSTLGSAQSIYDVVVSGNIAYAAAGADGLVLFNISNPKFPQQISALNTPGVAKKVAVSGNLAFVTEDHALIVVDISNPAALQQVGVVDTPGLAQGVAVSGDHAYVADFNAGLRIIDLAGGGSGGASACDAMGNCTEVEPAASLLAQSDQIQTARRAKSPVAQSDHTALTTETQIGVFIDPIPTSVMPKKVEIPITGIAHAEASLKKLTVFVNGKPIYRKSWPRNAVTQATWSTKWKPKRDGVYTVSVSLTDWAKPEQNTVIETWPVDIILDRKSPKLTISATELTSANYHAMSGQLDLSGSVSDDGGVVEVNVLIDGKAADVTLNGDRWVATWNVDPTAPPDGETHQVTVLARDVAGHTAKLKKKVRVDVVAPQPVTLTLTADGQVINPGQVWRHASPALQLEWSESADGSGLGGYEVQWQVRNSASGELVTTSSTVKPARGNSDIFEAGEGQQIFIQHTTFDRFGNRTTQPFGLIYVDGPLTPDYVSLDLPPGTSLPYDGWLENICNLVGVDRRLDRQAGELAALGDAQRFYATWDEAALRLAWTGADWESEGNLFIYLDTGPGGSSKAYNPFDGDETTIFLPGTGMEADTLIWVQDHQTALRLNALNGEWIVDGALPANQFRFDRGRHNGLTDLYLPFESLGIVNPASAALGLVAMATEEDALQLWGTMPSANPLNSSRVAHTTSFAPKAHTFSLSNHFQWSSLGAGQCANGDSAAGAPAANRYADSDLRIDLSADPVGTSVGFHGDHLFFHWEDLFGDRQTGFSSLFDFTDNSHVPLGPGQIVNYTVHFANLGTETAEAARLNILAFDAFSLLDGAGTSQVLDLGDIEPGETGSATFRAIVNGQGVWGSIEVQLFTDSHDESGPPLEWLFSEHQVDSAP